MIQRVFVLISLLIGTYGADVDAMLAKVCDANFAVSFGKEGAQLALDASIKNVTDEFGDKTEGVILEYIGDFSQSGEQLIGCAVVLRVVGTMKSKELLIEALGHLPTGFMSEASKALARLDGEGLAVELANRQAVEIDEDRKALLDQVLCNLSGKAQYGTIVAWAESLDSTERQRGISSLKNFSSEESRRLVRRALFDKDEKIFYNAIMSLGYIGEKNDIFLIQFLLQQAAKNAKGLDAIAMLSVLKDAAQKIKERETRPSP